MNYETISDNGSKYSFEIKDNKTEELSMKDINYDEVLDKWHDKVIEKADKYNEKADECELGSKDYYKFKMYSDGLYMAVSMLSLEERKAKRKLK